MRLMGVYRQALGRVLQFPWLVVVSVAALTFAALWMARHLPSEYAPNEDRGSIWMSLRAPEGASMEYTDRFTREMEAIVAEETGEGKPVKRYLTRLPGGWGSAAVNSSTPDRAAEPLG